MGLYIKGMEMPKDGNETIIRIQPDGTVLDQYGHYLAITAVLVPQHGRLIDADDFIKRITELMQKAEEDDFALGAAWYETFIRHIELAPAIIPAEESKENKL